MKQELLRILVVDDEPDMCWALENMLRPDGYAVATTTTGTEALELLAAESYAVAFVDAKLSDLDGLELAVLIRQRSPNTAVILISGYFYQADKAVIEGLQENSFVDFIPKPFDLKEVRSVTHQVLERARRENHAKGPHSSGG